MKDKRKHLEAEILPVKPGDIETIATLAREIWREHYPGIISIEQIEYMLAQRYDPRVMREELKRDDVWWNKIEAGGGIAGFSSYFLSGPGEMKLDKLYVRQDRQRKGYGGMLIERACAVARERDCSRLVLAVNKNNRNAIAAYDKYGFEIRDAVVKEIGGGFVMDDYIMVRKIE